MTDRYPATGHHKTLLDLSKETGGIEIINPGYARVRAADGRLLGNICRVGNYDYPWRAVFPSLLMDRNRNFALAEYALDHIRSVQAVAALERIGK